jgi:hypothetical protein
VSLSLCWHPPSLSRPSLSPIDSLVLVTDSECNIRQVVTEREATHERVRETALFVQSPWKSSRREEMVKKRVRVSENMGEKPNVSLRLSAPTRIM